MKAFEKWLKEDAPKVMPLRTEDREQITLEEAAECGYRRALEMVKSWCWPFSGADPIVKSIEEELES